MKKEVVRLIVYGYIFLIVILPTAVCSLFLMGGYFFLGGLLLVGNYLPILFLIREFLKRK